ncbi:MAG: hypothetical protein JWP14_2713 [Frankiales bacterium]|nr:hypothetical protein [Frankiales bacterium]
MSALRRTRGPAVIATFVVAIIGLSSATALAYWLTAAAGTGSATAKGLNAPTNVAGNATSGLVNWTASTTANNAVAPTSYLAERSDATTAARSWSTACTSTGTSCTDAAFPTAPGTYHFAYRVTARYNTAWSGISTESAVVDVTIANVATPAPFVVTAASPQVAGVAFNVTIQAKDSAGNDTSYTGSHALTIAGTSGAFQSSPGGTAPTVPTSANFSSGVATVSLTLTKAETTTITVKDGTAARDGASGSVVVSPAAVSKLAWTTVSSDSGLTTPAPCYFTCAWGSGFSNNKSFSATVLVTDTFGNGVSNVGTGRTIALSFSGTTTGGPTFTAPVSGTTQTLTLPASGLAQTVSFTWKAGNSNPWSNTVTAAPGTWTTPPTAPSNATTTMSK